jgi:hypothetical protein
MDLGLDMPDLDHPDLFRLNAVKAALDETRARLILDGVCRSDVIGLESLIPGVMQGANPNSFTQNTSNTKLNIALEAIDLKRFAIIGTAVTVAIGLLLKLFYWLKEMWVQFRAKQVTDAALKEAEHRLVAMRDFLAAEIAKETADDINGAAGNLVAKYGINAYSRFIYMYLDNEIRRKALNYKDAEKICTEILKVDSMQGTTQDDIVRYAFMYGMISNKSAHIQPIVAMLLPSCRPKDVAKLTNINYTVGITYGYLEEVLELIEGTYRAAHENRDMLKYVEGISMKLRDFIEKFNGRGNMLPYNHIWNITYELADRTVSTGKNSLNRIAYAKNHQVNPDPEVQVLIDYYRQHRSRRYGLYAWDRDSGLESFDREGVQLLNALTQQSQRKELEIYLRKLKTLAQNNYYSQMSSVLERIEKEHAWFMSHYKDEMYDTVRDHHLVAIKHLSITEVVDNAIAFVKSAIMATKQIEELNLGLAAAADRTLCLYTNAARDSIAFIKA